MAHGTKIIIMDEWPMYCNKWQAGHVTFTRTREGIPINQFMKVYDSFTHLFLRAPQPGRAVSWVIWIAFKNLTIFPKVATMVVDKVGSECIHFFTNIIMIGASRRHSS